MGHKFDARLLAEEFMTFLHYQHIIIVRLYILAAMKEKYNSIRWRGSAWVVDIRGR